MYLRARRRRPGREELDDDRDEGTGRGQAQADAHARPYRHTRAGPCRGRAAGSSHAVLTAYIRASRVLEGPLAAAYTIGARRTRPGQNKTRAQRAGFPSGARPLVAAVTLAGGSVGQGSSSCACVSAKGLPCMRSSEVQKRMYSGVTQQRLPLLSPWQPTQHRRRVPRTGPPAQQQQQQPPAQRARPQRPWRRARGSGLSGRVHSCPPRTEDGRIGYCPEGERGVGERAGGKEGAE